MGTKLNIFTGQLDLVGSGSGSGPVDAFSATFDSSLSWVGPVSDYYTITYTAAVHGKGINPAVQIFEEEGLNFNLVDVDRVQINAVGDVEIRVPATPDLRFVGKIIIL